MSLLFPEEEDDESASEITLEQHSCIFEDDRFLFKLPFDFAHDVSL